MGVRPLKVEVELTGVGLGKKVSPASEVFEIEELVFLDAVHGFDIALAGVSSGRDVHMLAASTLGKSPLNSLPLSVCQVRSRSETP